MKSLKEKEMYDKFADLLSELVELLEKYHQKPSAVLNEAIKENLSKMLYLSMSLQKSAESSMQSLKKEIEKYLIAPSNFDDVMKLCVILKNQLWEL